MGAAGFVGGIIAGIIAGMIANKFKTEKIYRLFWIMGISIAAFGSSLLFNLSANLTYIIFVIIIALTGREQRAASPPFLLVPVRRQSSRLSGSCRMQHLHSD